MNEFVEEIGIRTEWLVLRQSAQAFLKLFDAVTGAREWNADVDEFQRALNELETAVADTEDVIAFYPFDVLAMLAQNARRVLDALSEHTFVAGSEIETAVDHLQATMETVDREMVQGALSIDNFPAIMDREKYDAVCKTWLNEQARYFAAQKENDKLKALLTEWKDRISGFAPNIVERYQFTDRVNLALDQPFMRMLDAEEEAMLPEAGDPDHVGWFNHGGDIKGKYVTKVWSVDSAAWERAHKNGMAAMREPLNGLYYISNG